MSKSRLYVHLFAVVAVASGALLLNTPQTQQMSLTAAGVSELTQVNTSAVHAPAESFQFDVSEEGVIFRRIVFMEPKDFSWNEE